MELEASELCQAEADAEEVGAEQRSEEMLLPLGKRKSRVEQRVGESSRRVKRRKSTVPEKLTGFQGRSYSRLSSEV